MDRAADYRIGLTRRSFVQHMAASALLASPLARSARAADSSSPKQLIYHTETPANAEPALADLVQQWLTPTKYFYIRSHAPVPQIDPQAYRLSIQGLVEQPLSLSLQELNDLADTETVATLTCAGNRRSEHSQFKQVDGVPWNEGAIGNARWKGILLSTLLKRAGLKENARHVWFEGLDEIAKGNSTIHFGGSIPLEKAMRHADPTSETLVAIQMNGAPLLPDHGYPVRTVVPGYIGARSVKWLGRIVVSDHPSLNHYVQDAYKLIARDDELLLAEAGPIYPYGTNSAICIPKAGAKLSPGTLSVAGYALAQGTAGTAIARVEVSTDGGRTWTAAKLGGPAKPFCWQLWQAQVEIEPATRQLVVRASDSSGNRQPPVVDWNVKGYLYNAWHRVPVTVDG